MNTSTVISKVCTGILLVPVWLGSGGCDKASDSGAPVSTEVRRSTGPVT